MVDTGGTEAQPPKHHLSLVPDLIVSLDSPHRLNSREMNKMKWENISTSDSHPHSFWEKLGHKEKG